MDLPDRIEAAGEVPGRSVLGREGLEGWQQVDVARIDSPQGLMVFLIKPPVDRVAFLTLVFAHGTLMRRRQ